MIVNGIDHCHQKGFVHCDLKLTNILITFNADYSIKELCITDFGLSVEAQKFYLEDVPRRGSVPYMAPELYFNAFFDHMIDAWALGVILHELFTLRKPFMSTSFAQMAFEMKMKDLDFSANIWECLSIEAVDLVENLLRKD